MIAMMSQNELEILEALVTAGGRGALVPAQTYSWPSSWASSAASSSAERSPSAGFVAVDDALSRTSIDFFDFGTSRRTALATLGKGWWFGVALSPDERWLLFPPWTGKAAT
jgi:hypothetical protein